MNAVKELQWEPEGEEAKCYIGHLYVNLNSWASKKKGKRFKHCELTLHSS